MYPEVEYELVVGAVEVLVVSLIKDALLMGKFDLVTVSGVGSGSGARATGRGGGGGLV